MNNISKESYYKGFIAGYRAGIKAAYSGKIAEPEDVTVLEIPVNGSGLSALACNALHRAGCTYIADVVKATEREISMMRNVEKRRAQRSPTGWTIMVSVTVRGVCIYRSSLKPPLCKGRWVAARRAGGIVKRKLICAYIQ